MSKNFEIYRLRVEIYEKIIEAGIFNSDDKIELINGIIIEKVLKTPFRASSLSRAGRVFFDKMSDKAVIQNQNIVILDEYSAPEPDFALLKLPLNNYEKTRPTNEDVFLILEVSDKSLSFDRYEKGNLYSISNIPQYLILNLNTREIEDYREPSAEGYRFKRIYTANESFNLVAFPEIEIKVSDFLPNE